MKKLLVVLALLTVSTVGYADDDEVKVEPVVGDGNSGIFIVDGKKVYRCDLERCWIVSSDYTKTKAYGYGYQN